MRADRLLAIILLLQKRKLVTAKELSEQLELSERTIYRDIDALSSSGIPVYAMRGQFGGFALDNDFRVDLTGLQLEEVMDLFVNRFPGPLYDLGMGTKSDSIMRKLLASLPSSHRYQADQVNKRIHVDPVPWFQPREEATFLSILEQAMWVNSAVRFIYQEDGEDIIRNGVVYPYGLVAKTTIWYLVGESEGKVQVFRVSRFLTIEMAEQKFICPKEFDVAHFWKEWCREKEACIS